MLNVPATMRDRPADIKKQQDAWKALLEVAFLNASNSPDCIAVICNASVFLDTHQAVAAWNVWHMGSITQFNWMASRLSTLNDAELLAIDQAISRSAHLLADVGEVHVFSNSIMAHHMAMDASVHPG